MSLILNIDSSLQESSVSIARDGSMLQHLTNSSQKDHAAFLHKAIKEVLTAAGFTPGDLDAIAVTAGPGSYTGLRVGFAAAKGLSYALAKPLISINTTEAMAKAVWLANGKQPGYYCPMIDARRNEVYTAIYDSDNKEITAPHAMIVTPASYSLLPATENIFIFGSGAEKFKSICVRPNVLLKENSEIFSTLAGISFQKFKEKKFADLMNAVPLYAKEFYTG